MQAGGLVDALSNAGPFTVFAPTNDAFDLLPAGTVDRLLKPESKAEQVNAQKINITREGDKIFVNGDAEVLATINTANGIISTLMGGRLSHKVDDSCRCAGRGSRFA